MKKDTGLKKILDHPDLEEIISKLLIGISSKDIHSWLKSKYTNVSESKFVISEKALISFQDNYLDLYNFNDKYSINWMSLPLYKKIEYTATRFNSNIQYFVDKLILNYYLHHV